ncbi:MAG TPA: reverse transcriptase-like protein [Phycisphaerae bacterium]|nr:reverse transcriptase-like protein [Phycisphaerae bacterium]
MDLFPAADKSAPGSGKSSGPALTLHFDGGSRGNPGPAGIGVVLLDDKNRPLYELGEFLGQRTSNFAEYTALLRGLSAAKALRASRLSIKADSELVVRQINGIYKVKSADLLPLYRQAKVLMAEIGNVTISHVYREKNARADELANLAMDREAKIEPLGPPGTLGKPAPATRSAHSASEAPEQPDDATTQNIARLANLFDALRRTDEKLTAEQLQIFALIALRPGRTAAEIGDELKRTPAAVMRTVMDSLVTRHEFVYADNRDAEEDRLFLTERGERLLRQLLDAVGSESRL